VTLRIGARGKLVKDLQRQLRRRGMRVAVDGAFGPATRAAVRKLQKRMRLKPTGVVNVSLLKRLKIKVRLAAASTGPVRSTIAPGASPFLKVFPVAGDYSYSADYGAGRHQGRHEGVDIMADRNTPLVAVDDVTVKRLTRAETGLGGIWVWLVRADGTEYYYAHMASIAPGIDVGTRLTAGQVVGGVGNTGDARYGAPHLHFEVHPGGGASTAPYPHLGAVDPTAR
jgi:murein DD-endopeptidase MepM/ murein hydrolase activator NlpD